MTALKNRCAPKGMGENDLSRRELFKLALILVAGGLLPGRELHRPFHIEKQRTGYGSGTYGGA